MSGETARELLTAIRADISLAADSLLSGAEKGLRDVQAAREGQPGALDRLEAVLCALLEACAFQDLAGQRLSKLEGCIDGDLRSGSDPLLNGPALHGQGLDQSAIDALMGEASR
ncbi:MAG: hypothetical protein JNK30_11600 [Phenylobacterium sp.]|uniref:hypothetical protein n=1 Tax=Phenylobacterium sp. TaxID=1871053 RepID=UPI001A5C9513|nr:hypothetical protein [Phenylobacterium sp.]MBL8772015.1 hypothetical protein [Phenylobacterium sp.]